MAVGVSVIKKTVFGDLRVHILSITADAATGNIDTGLSYVYGFGLGPQTMATAAITLFPNALTSGTAGVGYIAMSAAAANDVFHLTVYGK